MPTAAAFEGDVYRKEEIMNYGPRFRIDPCTVCGTEREHDDQWGWWYDRQFCCSYHCMRKLEREDTERMRRTGAYSAASQYIDMPHKNVKPVTNAEREWIIELRKLGKSMSEICQTTGRSCTAVNRVLSEAGIKTGAPRGKQAIDRRAEIVKLRAKGLTISEICERLHVGRTTVGNAIRAVKND